MTIIPFYPNKGQTLEDAVSLEKINNLTTVLIQKVEGLKKSTDTLTPFEAQKELIPQLKKLGIEIDKITRKVQENRVRLKAG